MALSCVRGQAAAAAGGLLALDRQQHARGLLAPHHRDLGLGPHEQQPRLVGPAAHAVVARAVAAADDHRELGHGAVADGVDHLGPVLGDAAVLVLPAHHEAGDVLQEHQRDAPRVAQLDEVGALQGLVAEEDAVVGQDAHGVAVDAGEAADQGGAVARLELVHAAAVDDARDDLADVEGLARVVADHAVELLGIVVGILGRGARHAGRLHRPQVLDDVPQQAQGVGVVVGQVVGHAADARVHVAAAQLLGGDLLAGGRLHQRRPAQEDGALLLDDDHLVAHGRHVGAAGGARAQHGRDLRDAQAAHRRPGCRRCARSGRGPGRPRACRGRKAPPESTR